MATIDDLPDELLVDVASLLSGRDACHLGATCQRARHIATDPQLWRRLFGRDFGHLYKAAASRPLLEEWFNVESWPPEAHLLYERTKAKLRMPPACKHTDGLPLPFARAFVMGKDWQWMYRAHAISVDGRPRYSGPGTLRTRSGMMRTGDWIDGQRFGYHVKVCPAGRTWSEKFIRGQQGSILWTISYGARCTQYQTKKFRYTVWHGGDRRDWDAWGESAVGAVREWHDASSISIIDQANRLTIKPLLKGQAHGVVRTRFANGDVQAVHYDKGILVGGVEFVCSPSCPVPEYAGRILRCQWRRFYLASGSTFYHLLFPYDDDNSEDAKAFWDYVASGLIGWTDGERRCALGERSHSLLAAAVAP
jgi:hypothetical protein